MATQVLDKQLDLFADEKQSIAQARIYADAVHRWITADADRFKEVSSAFLHLAYRGAPIQQGRIHSELVKHGIHLSDDAVFCNNRNNYMVLTRYLRAFYPQLKPHVHIRKSWADYLTLRLVPFGYYLPNAKCQNRPVKQEDWQ